MNPNDVPLIGGVAMASIEQRRQAGIQLVLNTSIPICAALAAVDLRDILVGYRECTGGAIANPIVENDFAPTGNYSTVANYAVEYAKALLARVGIEVKEERAETAT